MRSTSKCCFLPRGRSWIWIIKKRGQMKKRKYRCPQTGTCKPMHCATPHGALNLLSALIRLRWSAVLIAAPGFRVCAIPTCHNHCVSEGWIAFSPREFVWWLTAHNNWKMSLFLVINHYGSCKMGLSRLVGAEEQLQLTSGLRRLPVCMEVGWSCQEKRGNRRFFSHLFWKPTAWWSICFSKILKKYWINVAVSYVKWNPKALIRIPNHMVTWIWRPIQLHFHIWCRHFKIHQFTARVVLVNLTNTITFLRCIITPRHVNINEGD